MKDGIMVAGAVSLLFIIIVVLIFLIPLCGIVIQWIVENVLQKELDGTLFWTGVALVDTYVVAEGIVGSSKKSKKANDSQGESD